MKTYAAGADNSPIELDSEGCPKGEANGRVKSGAPYYLPYL